MSFKELNLHDAILKAIEELGFQKPTSVQEQAIPHILAGRDIRAAAQTGTGKTAAFLWPLLQRLTKPRPGKGPRILVLVPTRELAMQVATEAAKYSKGLKFAKTVCLYGGAPYPEQNRQLRAPYDILVATPGRLIDHLERQRISFERLETLVLDEADRMLDMGFIEPVEQIMQATPASRQTLFFSATMKGAVLQLSKRLLRNPVEIAIDATEGMQQSQIEQSIYAADHIEHKYQILDHLLGGEGINQAIVFTATKALADEVADQLCDKGFEAAALHGDMSQHHRTRTIGRLRKGQVRILVATDVAARGIDVPAITHVINFDLPMNAQDYVHRIGRTGRAGSTGTALSLVAPKDRSMVRHIEDFIGRPLTRCVIPGLEPKKREKPAFAPKHRPFSHKAKPRHFKPKAKRF